LEEEIGKKVRGLFTAIITPFDGDGEVDADRMYDLVQFQISKGAEGIYPCGSTGLGPLMKTEERKTAAEAVLSVAKGKVPVVVQVGAADTSSTVELARHAEKLGAVAVASLTPYYYKPGERAIIRHFEAVSSAVDIPVFAYNIPQFTGNNLQPSVVAGMAKRGIIKGMKDSSRDLLQLLDLLDAVPHGFVVMNGTEEYALFAIMSGASGLVSGGASALPELFRALVVSERKGDHEAALEAQQTILKVKDLVKAGPISLYYSILKERGIDCGAPRQPLLAVEKEEAKRAIDGLKALNLI
jgi:4-hydroxy-tetrahydrodipicolinate synthase